MRDKKTRINAALWAWLGKNLTLRLRYVTTAANVMCTKTICVYQLLYHSLLFITVKNSKSPKNRITIIM